MQWEEVKTFHLCGPSTFGQFIRTEEDQLEYDLFKDTLTKNGLSLKTSIEDRYFKTNQNSYVIVPNQFPYVLEPNLEHLILWVAPNQTLNLETIETAISEFMRENSFSEWIYFQNKPQLQSVRDVEHWHIFGKHKS